MRDVCYPPTQKPNSLKRQSWCTSLASSQARIPNLGGSGWHVEARLKTAASPSRDSQFCTFKVMVEENGTGTLASYVGFKGQQSHAVSGPFICEAKVSVLFSCHDGSVSTTSRAGKWEIEWRSEPPKHRSWPTPFCSKWSNISFQSGEGFIR